MNVPVIAFSTKSGRQAELRGPRLTDAPALLRFINSISLEDTFVRFSGEQQTLLQEQTYINNELAAIRKGDAVKLFCFVEGTLAGVCDIHRDVSLLARKRHVGLFGIVIAKEFRGEGIGQMLMSTVIAEAQKKIKGLRLIHLQCFATNTPALSLYRKLGFVEVGRIPKGILHKSEYIDEVQMVKHL